MRLEGRRFGSRMLGGRERAVVLAVLALAVQCESVARAEERTLIMVLDAVPYGAMARLTSAGTAERVPLFAGFEAPIPLISTFPSSTSIALSGILGGLGLERSPGYEPRFFDWQTRRRRGGGPLSYFRIPFAWREFFDWNRKGPVRNAIHAARPVRAGIGEIAHAIAAFRASSVPVFSIYVADTDTAGHLFGPTGPDLILEALDGELRDLDSTRIVLLSDHGLAGGEPLVNVLPAVRRRIADHGWRWTEGLTRKGDVVLTPYGLVSSFEAYADAELTPALAGALAGVAGVDFCVAPTQEGWRVVTAESTLDFERREGQGGVEWRWRVVGGTSGLAAALSAAQVVAQAADAPKDPVMADWVSDEALLAATAMSAYPDPLYRLAGAFSAVENPASVICSVEPGYMFGARGTERSAKWTKGALRWTHGALDRDASLGFLMSNRVAVNAPSAVRFDRALEMVLGAGATRTTSH